MYLVQSRFCIMSMAHKTLIFRITGRFVFIMQGSGVEESTTFTTGWSRSM